MGAIALVIFYCTPGSCGMSVAGYFPQKAQCEAQSQMAVAQWHGEHPNVKVSGMRISCLTPEQLADIFKKDEA